MNPIKKQQGTSMLEVLITALILSLGLLGLAGLQVKSMQFNHSAYLRSQATLLAYDMADRIRANTSAVASYDSASTSDPGEVGSCKTTTGCSTTQMAQTDLSQWKQAVAATLPNGLAVSCLDDSPNDGIPTAPACGGGTHFAIKIWWTDDKDPAEPPQLFAISFRP
jgi:type IV pilus assembly protein PilV